LTVNYYTFKLVIGFLKLHILKRNFWHWKSIRPA